MKSPVIDQKSFLASAPSVLSHLEEGLEKTVRLILFEKCLVPLLVQDDPWIMSFAEMGWYSTIAPNGITGPLKDIPNRLSHGCLPIRQEILNVSQIAVTLHGISPPFFIKTWLLQYCRSPSLILRTVFSAMPFVSDLCGADVQWLQDNSSQDFPRNCECKWLLVSLSAPGTSLGSSFWVSWEVFVLHG